MTHHSIRLQLLRSWLEHLQENVAARPKLYDRNSDDPSRMLDVHMLAGYLSNVHDLRKVAAIGASLIFPKLLSPDCLPFRIREIPHPVRVGEQRVCLDAAYLLLRRREVLLCRSACALPPATSTDPAEQQQQGMSRWTWVDSSPQAHRDWFQCKESWAYLRDLPSLARSVDRLTLDQTASPCAKMTAAEARECNKCLATGLHVHMKVPTGKAEGHSSIEHLAACWALCSYWEAGSVEELDKACAEHVSMTSDMGTDAGIRGMLMHSVADVLPPWLRHREQQQHQPEQQPMHLFADLAGDVIVPSASHEEPRPVKLQPLLHCAVEVPGSLHIITNIPKDLSCKLSHWAVHMQKWKIMLPLLSEPYHRERLRATCLSHAPADIGQLFEKFHGNLYEHRWMAVYTFIAKAMPLVSALRTYWNSATFTAGFSKQKAHKDKDTEFSPMSVSRVLDDPMFGAYNHLVLSVGSIMRRMSSWLESCPCHSKYVRDIGKWRRAPVSWRAVFPELGERPSCPVAGCRAPELAGGAVDDMMSIICDYCLADMVRKFPESLSETDRALALTDFELAKAYFLLGVRLKFDVWRRLPLCLAALAHHLPEKRQAAAVHALQEFDGSLAAGFDSSMHHPLALQYLAAGSELRPLVEQCAAGHGVAAPLHFAASKLKFIPVVERTLCD